MVVHTLRCWLSRSARAPKSKPMRRHPRCAPSLQPLEDRLVAAVQLTYEAPSG